MKLTVNTNVPDQPTGRYIAQRPRIRVGRNDDLGTAPGDHPEQSCH